VPTIAARVTALRERIGETPWLEHEFARGWGVFAFPSDSGHERNLEEFNRGRMAVMVKGGFDDKQRSPSL
jgi:hypothetical protein